MKTFLLSAVILLCAAVVFRSIRFNFLDFTNPKLDISWDDITEDLWP